MREDHRVQETEATRQPDRTLERQRLQEPDDEERDAEHLG